MQAPNHSSPDDGDRPSPRPEGSRFTCEASTAPDRSTPRDIGFADNGRSTSLGGTPPVSVTNAAATMNLRMVVEARAPDTSLRAARQQRQPQALATLTESDLPVRREGDGGELPTKRKRQDPSETAEASSTATSSTATAAVEPPSPFWNEGVAALRYPADGTAQPVPLLPTSDALLYANLNRHSLGALAHTSGTWHQAVVATTPHWEGDGRVCLNFWVELDEGIPPLVLSSLAFDENRELKIVCFDSTKVSDASQRVLAAVRRVRVRCSSSHLSPLMRMMPSVTDLSIEECISEDLSFLYALPHPAWLETLEFSGCPSLQDISALCELTSLKALRLSIGFPTGRRFAFSNISSLAHLKDLEVLHIQGVVNVSDISPLSSLASLRELKLGECDRLSDISPLATMSLTSLTLHRVCSLSNISPLSSLTSLEELVMVACRDVTDFTPLKSMTVLRRLTLDTCCGLKDVVPLTSLKSLRELKIRLSGVKDFVPLASLKSLSSLHISDIFRKINVAQFACLPSLRRIELMYGKPPDIESLAALPLVESLCLHGFRELPDFTPFPSLRQLEIWTCVHLHDISTLSSLTSLEELVISECRSIVDITPLASMTALKRLTFDICCTLSDITPLTSLKSLRELTLRHCHNITDGATLASMTQLEKITLGSTCEIACHPAMSSLPSTMEVVVD